MGNAGSHTCSPCDEATEKPYFCYDDLSPCIVIFSFYNLLLFLLSSVKHFGKHKRKYVFFSVFQKPCKEFGTLDVGSHVQVKFIFIFLLSSETRFQVTTWQWDGKGVLCLFPKACVLLWCLQCGKHFEVCWSKRWSLYPPFTEDMNDFIITLWKSGILQNFPSIFLCDLHSRRQFAYFYKL